MIIRLSFLMIVVKASIPLPISFIRPKGHIESAGYYFDPKNTDRFEALDALLLTQGWRRFLFEKAIGGQWAKPSIELERGITISGKVIDKFSNKPVNDGKVTYFNMYPIPDIKQARTSADGKFRLEKSYLFDSAKTVLQGETKKGNKLIKFIIDSINPAVPGDISTVSSYRNA